MIESINKVRKTIDELHKKHILVMDIDIIYELDCQLNEEISEEDYIKLYEEIRHAYLKTNNIDVATIVYCALENKDKIINDDESFDLREESCYYV